MSGPTVFELFYFGTFISTLFLNRRKFLVYLFKMSLFPPKPPHSVPLQRCCTALYWFHRTHLHPSLSHAIHPSQSHLTQFVCYISTLLYHIAPHLARGKLLIFCYCSCTLFYQSPYFVIYLIIWYFFCSIYLICQSTPILFSLLSSTLFSHLPYLSSTSFSNLTIVRSTSFTDLL